MEAPPPRGVVARGGSRSVPRSTRRLTALAAGATYNIHDIFSPIVGNQGGIEIQYESLSGRKYRTIVTWEDAGSMVVRFDNISDRVSLR